MLDPISRRLADAPREDEAISQEEERTVAASREWLRHRQAIPHEDVLAGFGSSLADL